MLVALVHSGALDTFAVDDESVDAARARLLGALDTALQGAEQTARDAELGIADMFGGVAKQSAAPTNGTVRALSTRQRLEGEKETLGLYLTGHPVNAHLAELRQLCPPIGQLRSGRDKQLVAGLVVSNRTRRGRRGEMGFFVLDDQSARIEVSAFGETFAKSRAKIAKDAILVVQGDVQQDSFSGGVKMRAEQVMTLAEARKSHSRGIVVRLAAQAEERLPRLRQVLARHREADGCTVFVEYAANGAQGRFALGAAWRVHADDALLIQLRETLGEDAAIVDY